MCESTDACFGHHHQYSAQWGQTLYEIASEFAYLLMLSRFDDVFYIF